MRASHLFCAQVLFVLAVVTSETRANSLPASNCNLQGTHGLCYTDADKRRFVLIDSTNRQCHMIVDRVLVEEALRELSYAGAPPYVVPDDRLSSIISTCQGRNLDRPRRSDQKRNLMFPGTKWCGPGDDADDFDDLGELKELDKCCRKHDHCPDNIKHGKSKHNITNTSAFTMSHCDCDEEFHSCLKKVNTDASSAVGLTYFSMGFVKCFRLALPVDECLEWSGLFSQTCNKYKFDESGKYTWQVFDLPSF